MAQSQKVWQVSHLIYKLWNKGQKAAYIALLGRIGLGIEQCVALVMMADFICAILAVSELHLDHLLLLIVKLFT